MSDKITQEQYDALPVDIRLKYAGAIGLLCECAVNLGHGSEKDEMRDSIEQAAQDWCAMTGWKVRRILHRIEVEAP